MEGKKSLKQEPLRMCILRIREGNQPAFSELMEAYAPLIAATVSRYGTGLGKQDCEDLHQVALLALYRAAMAFDLEQSEVEFGLYAKICITNALVSQLRLIRRRPFELSVEEEMLREECVEDPARRVIEQEEAEALYARIRSLLSPYEARVWHLHVAGYRSREIASLLKKPTHSIENAVYRIRQKLMRELR